MEYPHSSRSVPRIRAPISPTCRCHKAIFDRAIVLPTINGQLALASTTPAPCDAHTFYVASRRTCRLTARPEARFASQ